VIARRCGIRLIISIMPLPERLERPPRIDDVIGSDSEQRRSLEHEARSVFAIRIAATADDAVSFPLLTVVGLDRCAASIIVRRVNDFSRHRPFQASKPLDSGQQLCWYYVYMMPEVVAPVPCRDQPNGITTTRPRSAAAAS